MPTSQTRRVVLRTHPEGVPDASCLALDLAPLPAPGEGEVELRTLWLSVDPYLRNRMAAHGSRHLSVFKPGAPIESDAVAQVVASRHPGLAPGDLVLGSLPWQERCVCEGAPLQRLDGDGGSPSRALGVLGMPGMTGYFGMVELGRPEPGETVVVSSAAGAVGSVAGQIARIAGARVIGLAGSPDKVRYLEKELGFARGLDYRAPDFEQALDRETRGRVDLYFENVGGAVGAAVVQRIRPFGRIVLCGMISTYHDPERDGMANLWPVLLKGLRVFGLMVGHYRQRWPEGQAQMRRWLDEGKLRASESIAEGLEGAPGALADLFAGRSLGKQLVRVADPA